MRKIKYDFTEIEAILRECRLQIAKMAELTNPYEVLVLMPDYFRRILDEYFRETCGQAMCDVCFGTGATFYGVKNFYPSPSNEIIISCLSNPLKDESLEVKIQLK